MNIVTLQQASDHLRLDIDFSESPVDDELIPELTDKLFQANAIIVNYLKVGGDSPEWEPDEVDEPAVRASVLLVLSAIWDNKTGENLGKLFHPQTGTVALILMRMRDPAFA